jgi:hypothetical protein
MKFKLFSRIVRDVSTKFNHHLKVRITDYRRLEVTKVYAGMVLSLSLSRN